MPALSGGKVEAGRGLRPADKAGEAGGYSLYSLSLMVEKGFHPAKHALELDSAVSPRRKSVKGLRVLIQ